MTIKKNFKSLSQREMRSGKVWFIDNLCGRQEWIVHVKTFNDNVKELKVIESKRNAIRLEDLSPVILHVFEVLHFALFPYELGDHRC